MSKPKNKTEKINVVPDPYVVQRMLEILAAQHGVTMEAAAREAATAEGLEQAKVDAIAEGAGNAAYHAYFKALKVIVAELTSDIDVKDVYAHADALGKEKSR